MVIEAVESESMAVEVSFLYDTEIEHARKHNTSWYRSKEGGTNPFKSYLMSKKWSLVEEMNLHIMRFQQVTVLGHI